MTMGTQEFISQLKFDSQGLIPAVIQDAKSHRVLMVAFMNRQAIELSLRQGETFFWSRSRQKIWHKGESSGNRQKIVRVELDCDFDTLLVSVDAFGPACHTGSASCFDTTALELTGEAGILSQSSMSSGGFQGTVERLVKVLEDRKARLPEGSYTTYLFSKGIDKILKKVGEETAETIIAAKNDSKAELIMESADLLYHLLVLLVNQGVSIEEVLAELERRAGKKREKESAIGESLPS